MNRIFLLLCLLSPMFVFSQKDKIPKRNFTFDRSQTIDCLTFGSCNKHTKDQPIWKGVLANEPDVWLWLGDIIYGNTKNMSKLRSKYAFQKNKLEYKALLDSNCDVVGIYDDHDYGKNNAGKEYPKKEQSRDVLFEFLDVPKDDKARSHEGAYNSFEYGEGDQTVKVILLDGRYNRDKPGKGEDILGEKQWAWLDKELKESDAHIHIIGTGIQIIPYQHKFERWNKFPESRTRLLSLLAKHGTNGVVFITGDRHIAEISKIDWPYSACPFYEITASGMTHFYPLAKNEKNKHRIGSQVAAYNFGMIKINWEERTMDLQIRGIENVIHESTTVTF